jgi:transposase-like protein
VVFEVLKDGAAVTDVARRHGVSRRTVHDWLNKYAAQGLRGWPIGARGPCRATTRCIR